MRKPPPKGEFWRAFAAVTILPISGTDKAVLGCLVDFANSETGACWPGQNTIARATRKDIRVVAVHSEPHQDTLSSARNATARATHPIS
jgi:hypothetical protein